MKTKIKDILELLLLMLIVGWMVLLFVKVTDTDAEQLPLLQDNNNMLHNLTNNK